MAAFRIARAAASVPAASFSLTAVLKACVIWWALACTRGRTSPPRSAANPRASVCASLAVSTPLPPGAIVSRGRGGGEEEEDEGEDERGGRESVCVLEREREYVCVCNRERERERESVCVCVVWTRERVRERRERRTRGRWVIAFCFALFAFLPPLHPFPALYLAIVSLVSPLSPNSTSKTEEERV
jgi:hypothetical protein